MSYIGKIGISRLDPENLFDFNIANQMAKEGGDRRNSYRILLWLFCHKRYNAQKNRSCATILNYDPASL